MTDLENLRKEIESIDEKIVELMVRRNDTAKKVGALKNDLNLPLRNIDVEKKVIERYRKMAEDTSLPPNVSEAICRILIESSVDVQSTLIKKRCDKKVTIFGGTGGMGRWLRGYLEGMGADVNIVGRTTGRPEDAKDSDVVVLSVPPSAIADALRTADAVCKNDALIFDISSIKSPFVKEIKALAKHRKVCSVHHMFGPSVSSMLNRNVVVCDCGSKEAVVEAAELFDNEGSNLIFTSVERHDQLMAYVLAFAHASNIVFFTALKESGIPFSELEKISSTTFRRCLNTCIPVSEENAPLYHEIQYLNDNTEKMWDVFERALKEVKEASLSDDPKMFIDIMEKGKEYLKKN